MTETRKLHGSVVLALVLALAPATAAVAADKSSDQAEQSGSNASASNNASSSGNGSGMAAEDVTDEDLKKFGAAYMQMQQIRAEYGKKMKQAKDDKSKQQQLRKKGQQEMVSAIQDQGLEIAEYRQIGKALNNDKELRSRFKGMMQEQQSGNSASSESGSS